ncbi:MAG: hypothetical protein ACRDN1_25285 [Trebonia sp.]
MSPQPCPGSCNSRFHKAWDAYERELAAYDPLDPHTSRPEQPDDTLIREYGNPVWCTEHTSAIRLALAQLDDLACIYAASADGHRSQPATQRVGGSTLVLSQSEAHDQLDELTSAITGWEHAYRDHMRWAAPPPRGDLATVQTSCINWLSRQLDGILASPLAADFGREVLEWKPLVAARAKAGQRTLLLEARCPGHQCGQRMLTWKEGTDRVECANRDCLHIMTKTAYDELSAVQAEHHRTLFHRGRECDCHLRRAVRPGDLDFATTRV